MSMFKTKSLRSRSLCYPMVGRKSFGEEENNSLSRIKVILEHEENEDEDDLNDGGGNTPNDDDDDRNDRSTTNSSLLRRLPPPVVLRSRKNSVSNSIADTNHHNNHNNHPHHNHNQHLIHAKNNHKPSISTSNRFISQELINTTTTANSRRSSIALSKYITNHCDSTRLNKIPLRRYSLNAPLSEYSKSLLVPATAGFPLIRKKSLDPSKMSQVSRSSDMSIKFKFGTQLSPSAQCAMLKSYEDELYNRMKVYMPRKKLPRINTAKFLAASRHRRPTAAMTTFKFRQQQQQSDSQMTSSRCSSRFGGAETPIEEEEELVEGEDPLFDDSNHHNNTNNSTRSSVVGNDYSLRLEEFAARLRSLEREEEGQLKIVEHMEKAMKLLDLLEESCRCCEKSGGLEGKERLESAARKYEKWQRTWSKMLDECF